MLYEILKGEPFTLTRAIVEILAMLFIIFFILPLHEFAHAWAASKLDDNTAKNSGRLTLNPIVSFDMIGAVLLLLIGFGWAKPVPINPRNFKNPKRDTAITAFAGPLSNLIAALIGSIIFYAICVSLHYYPLIPTIFFSYYVEINISLAVFNLIPLPPLDGSKILGAFLSDRAISNYYRYQNIIIIFVLIILFTGVLNRPISFLVGWCSAGIDWLAQLPFKLFGAL